MVIAGVGATAMFTSGRALAAPAADGVFFVHGTGDQAAPSTQVNPTNGAVTGYWTQASINTMVTDPAGGKWTYGASGTPGSSQNALQTAVTVATQLDTFKTQNTAVTGIVLVTHSNGSNPIRYMTAHTTAVDSNGKAYSTLLASVKRIIFIAGDNKGTPLADKVTTAGTFANIANDVVSAFGLGNYNSPAVLQQVQATMTTYNGNGTFSTGTTIDGISTYYVYGTNVYANIFSGDAWCGGYADTVGLKATQIYGWGSSSAACDGFIGVNSSTYVGTAGMSGDSRLNHNQSRVSCHGVGATIAGLIHGANGGAFTAIPPDYTISPAAQACNATTQGWQSASPYAGNFYWYGCTSAMRTDSNTDFDCQTSYGGDNGYDLSAAEYPTTVSSYFVNSYYSGGAGCSDSWLGDGECDLCLLAKYGYDSASGSSADDDCVNQGSGTQTACADLADYDQTNAIGYYSYMATH
jgi:hypothetical protein